MCELIPIRIRLIEIFSLYKPAVVSDGKIDWLNYIAYMDGHHKYMFDQENLVRRLNAGFIDAQPRNFDALRDRADRKMIDLRDWEQA